MSASRSRVVSAAMLMKDGLVVTGVRHFSPEMRAVLKRIYGEGYHLQVKEQGFIDASCQFLSREDAWKRAAKHDQIFTYGASSDDLIPAKVDPDIDDHGALFSENLY